MMRINKKAFFSIVMAFVFGVAVIACSFVFLGKGGKTATLNTDDYYDGPPQRPEPLPRNFEYDIVKMPYTTIFFIFDNAILIHEGETLTKNKLPLEIDNWDAIIDYKISSYDGTDNEYLTVSLKPFEIHGISEGINYVTLYARMSNKEIWNLTLNVSVAINVGDIEIEGPGGGGGGTIWRLPRL